MEEGRLVEVRVTMAVDVEKVVRVDGEEVEVEAEIVEEEEIGITMKVEVDKKVEVKIETVKKKVESKSGHVRSVGEGG